MCACRAGGGGGVKEEKWGWGERRWGRLGHGGCVCGGGGGGGGGGGFALSRQSCRTFFLSRSCDELGFIFRSAT